MVIFHSYVTNYQRVLETIGINWHFWVRIPIRSPIRTMGKFTLRSHRGHGIYDEKPPAPGRWSNIYTTHGWASEILWAPDGCRWL